MTNKQKILQISKELGLSHIGSCLSVLPILEEIYKTKRHDDVVILDNAHAHLAHLVVQDGLVLHYEGATGFQHINVKAVIEEHGIHCDRKAGCDASGGSLGHGLGIGIGYALANPDKTVYVIVSDGSMMEGSNWEALRILSNLSLKNVVIYTNFNGYTAVAYSDKYQLMARMRLFHPNINYRMTNNAEPFDGVQGHYRKVE